MSSKHLIIVIYNQDNTFRSVKEEVLGMIGDDKAVLPIIKLYKMII